MGYDVYSIFSVLGFLYDLSRSCSWSRRVSGLILPEKCGKSNLCNGLTSRRCVLVDLDEVLKSSSENSDKIQRLKQRGDYQTLTLLVMKEAGELLGQIKKLHKYKRLILVSSSSELLDSLRVPYGLYVPSNNLTNEIVGKLPSELKPCFESSRQVLIQNKAAVFGSWEELSNIIAEKFDLQRKL